jgi:hypothetical protein
MIKIKVNIDLKKEIEESIKRQEDAIKLSMKNALVAATPVDTGEARAGWRVEGKSIVNDVDHIDDLNKGSSQQAPSYFVEKTLLSFPGVKPDGTIVRSK